MNRKLKKGMVVKLVDLSKIRDIEESPGIEPSMMKYFGSRVTISDFLDGVDGVDGEVWFNIEEDKRDGDWIWTERWIEKIENYFIDEKLFEL